VERPDAIGVKTHTIRLRDPWEHTSDGIRTTHSRNFGRPRTLEEGERVWFVCAHVPGAAEIALNGRPVATLDAAGLLAVDITDQLEMRNRVELVVGSGELLGEVALEIRSDRGSPHATP
jgi:hypothetical protein